MHVMEQLRQVTVVLLEPQCPRKLVGESSPLESFLQLQRSVCRHVRRRILLFDD